MASSETVVLSNHNLYYDIHQLYHGHPGKYVASLETVVLAVATKGHQGLETCGFIGSCGYNS